MPRSLLPTIVPLLVVLLSGRACADPIKGDPGAGDGSQLFRTLLHLRNIKPVKETELAATHFDDLIVIILGDPNPKNGRAIPSLNNPLQAALRGSSILLATHLNCSFSLQDVEFNISGDLVHCRSKEHILWGNIADCPFVVPEAGVGDINSVFGRDGGPARLTKVAAGSASYLNIARKNQPRGLERLAVFPDDCEIMIRTRLGALPNDACFAAGGEIRFNVHASRSRFLVIASSHVFNNGLMCSEDTQNLELCSRVIDYLQGPGQTHKRCAFFENGRLVDHFDDLARVTTMPPINKVPVPMQDMSRVQQKVVELANHALAQVEENDAANRMAKNLLTRPVIAGLLTAAGVVAAIFLFLRVYRNRKPADTPAARAVTPAATGPPGVFASRGREILRAKNIFEPVRDRIRDFFASAGASEAPGPVLPPVWISRRVRKPNSLRQALRDFWKIAFGPAKVLDVIRWKEMEPYFERVCQAHSSGKWGFERKG